jgi:hypothetical protein
MFGRRKTKNRELADQPQIMPPATRAAEFIVNDSLVPEKRTTHGFEKDDFTDALSAIAQRFSIASDSAVLYPGSSTHMGVAFTFGKDRVTHVDPDELACSALQQNGCNAVVSTFEDLSVESHFDVLVALNSYGTADPEALARVLKPGALIIANNYTHWADDIRQSGVAHLEGAIFPAYFGPGGGNYSEADQLPDDATELSMAYYNITREGNVSPGTPDNNTFSDIQPKYPDALFVFTYSPDV